MLIDEMEIVVQGGHGGPGSISFGKKAHSGPDGGNGGKGGDFYIRASSDITLLNQFSQKKEFSAKAGQSGGRNKQSGKSGSDFELLIPVGTEIIDQNTNEVIVELKDVDQRVLLCTGGKGGKGNYEFRSPRRTTPEIAQPGLPGEQKHLKLVLKLIADFGLVGLPNAGKSSLLNELTHSKAKIADYPFTTLSPNLGVYNGKIIADIPGLIEGASQGRGLGISFLKHIEKVKVILHCLSCETSNPLKDYRTIRLELEKYNPELLNKPEILLITKTDLADSLKIKHIEKSLSDKSENMFKISIHDWESVEEFKNMIKHLDKNYN